MPYYPINDRGGWWSVWLCCCLLQVSLKFWFGVLLFVLIFLFICTQVFAADANPLIHLCVCRLVPVSAPRQQGVWGPREDRLLVLPGLIIARILLLLQGQAHPQWAAGEGGWSLSSCTPHGINVNESFCRLKQIIAKSRNLNNWQSSQLSC